jgi:tetratricopeptide (TPR) repeat protein
MTRGKKISRKELLKKPDEFITLSTRIVNLITANLQKTILIGSGGVLLAAAYFGYSAYQNRQERLAHEKYFSVIELPDIETRIKKLEEIGKEFSGTKGGFDAQVATGHLYYQKKDFPKAVAAYQGALNKGNFPPAFRPLIQESLAYALEQKGDLQQAAATFSEIAQGKENFLKEDVLLSLARVYEKLNKSQEAKSTYQTFLKSFPKSIYAPLVKERLVKFEK